MERGNFSAAAGFGMVKGKQGIFGTFAAFLEMCISEITMARLNNSNVLCHFSHSGSDDMADNTCHFGINNMFADNGLEENDGTALYFPADANQLKACLDVIFHQGGLRFLFTTRSKVPQVLNEKGVEMFGAGYTFRPGKDDIVRTGTAGYIVSFGDALYRCVDAVDRLKKEGIDVGLVNKSTLNVVDEDMMKTVGKTGFVLVVEPLSKKCGLGTRFGTWLITRGLTPKFAQIGCHKEGCGGLWEHAYHQGYDPKSVMEKVKSLV
jgi:transketolase C-terminal domain/subunit